MPFIKSDCRSYKHNSAEKIPPYNQLIFYHPDLKYNFRLKHFLSADPSERIGLSSATLLDHMKKLDEREDYSFYTPSEKDKIIIKESLEKLPPLVKENFQKNVLGVYFINNFISTGYTDWVMDSRGNVYSVILINPAVFHMNISKILNKRESTCFKEDSSKTEIHINAGGNESAFLYIFLHESVHAADYSLRISDIDEEAYNKVKHKIKRNPERGMFPSCPYRAEDRG